MEKAAKPATKSGYRTATSLTARQINRSVILNIIYSQQPISRADTARATGLQRSTVSLIVDELIEDGWVVEGEYHRIPRGRRPVFLQINAKHAGLLGVYITSKSVELGVADLNGNIQWTAVENFSEFSLEKLRLGLQHLAEKAGNNHDYQIKGVGVALNDLSDDDGKIEALVGEIFPVPVAIDCLTVACGKWFLVYHKDAKLANNHLVSVNADTERIELGIIIAGKPLRGAHGRAGKELSDAPSDGNGNGSTTVARTTKELVTRLEFAVAAYDPGVVLLTGPLSAEAADLLPELEKRLKQINAGDTAVRILDSENEQENTYMKSAIAVTMGSFLDECPG